MYINNVCGIVNRVMSTMGVKSMLILAKGHWGKRSKILHFVKVIKCEEIINVIFKLGNHFLSINNKVLVLIRC